MEELEDLARKHKLALRPTFIFLAILFISLYFLKPKILEIFEFRQKVTHERKVLAELTKKVASLESLDKTELSQKTGIVLRLLPPEKDVPTFLLSLKALSSQTGVNIKEIKVDPGKLAILKEGIPVLTFTIKTEGELDNTKEFLRKIEATVPLIRIESVSFSSEKGVLNEAVLTLDGFFLPLPKTIGAPESPLPLISSQEEEAYQKLSGFSPPFTEEGVSVQSGKENPFSL